MRGRTGSRSRNHRLVYWQDRAGFNNTQLAKAILDAAQQAGHRNVHPDARRVRAWRHGERPRDPVPDLLIDVLGTRLGIPVTRTDLGLADPVPDQNWRDSPWIVTHTVSDLIGFPRSDLMLGRRDVEHQHRHQLLGGDEMLTTVRPWITTAPDPLESPTGSTHGRIGLREVTHVRAVTDALRALDNLHGGGLAREAAVGHLTWAASLLDDATYTERVGRELFAAVADLAGVAGWMCNDVNLHAAAQHYFLLALRAAKEAADPNLGAHILNCMARQAGHLSRPDDALELVHLALYGARHSATPTIRAVLHSLEARSHAAMGHRGDFDRAAGHAEDAFADRDPADDPGWAAFFDHAEYHATLGVCHQIAARTIDPRRADRAIHMIGHAIGSRDRGRTRSVAFDHIGLARTHLTTGDLDEANDAATTALGLLGTVNSTRVHDRLRELLTETHSHAGTPVITELRDRIIGELRGEH